MYAYDFKPKQKAINFNEVFIVMPFDETCDNIFEELIKPAVEKASTKLGFSGRQSLQPYRTIDDIRTTSGWINVLEHLLTAQIVLGVLTSDNPNVFYELGIAHATEPITRQILIANKGYKPRFDLKDLIYYEYEDNLKDSIDPLADKIKDAIDWYKIEEEKRVHQARMLIGPWDFEILMNHGKARNFAIHTTEGREAYEKQFGAESFEKHILAITNLCQNGLLGLDTSYKKDETGVQVVVYFSYHWTNLGNCVLHLMGLIPKEEMFARRENLPPFFE